MTETEALLAARALLADVTPLRTDCGRCCGAVCEMDKETGDAIRKGQITHIDLTRYGFKRIRRCPKCGYIPQDNDFDFCPKCGARL